MKYYIFTSLFILLTLTVHSQMKVQVLDFEFSSTEHNIINPNDLLVNFKKSFEEKFSKEYGDNFIIIPNPSNTNKIKRTNNNTITVDNTVDLVIIGTVNINNKFPNGVTIEFVLINDNKSYQEEKITIFDKTGENVFEKLANYDLERIDIANKKIIENFEFSQLQQKIYSSLIEKKKSTVVPSTGEELISESDEKAISDFNSLMYSIVGYEYKYNSSDIKGILETIENDEVFHWFYLEQKINYYVQENETINTSVKQLDLKYNNSLSDTEKLANLNEKLTNTEKVLSNIDTLIGCYELLLNISFVKEDTKYIREKQKDKKILVETQKTQRETIKTLKNQINALKQ